MQKQIELPIYGSFEVLSTDESDGIDGNASTTMMGWRERKTGCVCKQSRGDFQSPGHLLSYCMGMGPSVCKLRSLSLSLHLRR